MIDAEVLFTRLLAFCERHGLPVPDSAAPHAAEPRVALFAPPGADADSLLADLGVSAVVAADSRSAEALLERVALPILATPAVAVFGMAETRAMRRLNARGRPFAVVISGLRVMNEAKHGAFLAEIEQFALAPLRIELGDFPLFLDSTDLAPLRAWIDATVGQAQHRRLALLVSEWLEDLCVHVAALVAEAETRGARLARVEWHLGALVDYVAHDVPAKEAHGHFAEFAEFYADVLSPVGDPLGLAEFEAAARERLETEREKLIAGELAREFEALTESTP